MYQRIMLYQTNDASIVEDLDTCSEIAPLCIDHRPIIVGPVGPVGTTRTHGSQLPVGKQPGGRRHWAIAAPTSSLPSKYG